MKLKSFMRWKKSQRQKRIRCGKNNEVELPLKAFLRSLLTIAVILFLVKAKFPNNNFSYPRKSSLNLKNELILELKPDVFKG